MDPLDKMYKPEGIRCPKCKSKKLVEYTESKDFELSDDELWLGPNFTFTCEDCEHNF